MEIMPYDWVPPDKPIDEWKPPSEPIDTWKPPTEPVKEGIGNKIVSGLKQVLSPTMSDEQTKQRESLLRSSGVSEEDISKYGKQAPLGMPTETSILPKF